MRRRRRVHAPLPSGLLCERDCWDAADDRPDGSPEPLRRAEKTQALGKEVPHGREAVEELGRELAQTSPSRCLPRRALGNGFRGSARRVFAGTSQTNTSSWVPREMNLEADTLASRAL